MKEPRSPSAHEPPTVPSVSAGSPAAGQASPASASARVEAADTGKFDHVAFNAQGVNETMRKLKRLGIPFDRVTVPKLEKHPQSGGTQLFFKDPDNILIELQFTSVEQVEEVP